VTAVAGYCPACGNRTLFLGKGGYVTCSLDVCPNPTAAADLLSDQEIQHIVVLDADPDVGFTIRHPVIERVTGDLFTCNLHTYLSQRDGPPARPGSYRVHRAPTGWAWEVLS
jgi:hypothetical protein